MHYKNGLLHTKKKMKSYIVKITSKRNENTNIRCQYFLAKQKRFAKKNYMKTTINYLKNDAHCFSIVPFDNYIAITQQI